MKKMIVLAGVLVSNPIVAEEFCNEENYKEYIASIEKTATLVEETGRGCQLKGAYLEGAQYIQKSED